MNKQATVITTAILLIVAIISSLQTTLAKADTQSVSIQAANSSIDQAYTNVLAAEKAGGNVTQLLERLNSAGELLADAENAYRSGNLANVMSKADNVTLIANQVGRDALKLRYDSLAGSENSFWLTVFFSEVGTVVFGAALLFVWRWFKRFYMRRLLGMKPEVVENEP